MNKQRLVIFVDFDGEPNMINGNVLDLCCQDLVSNISAGGAKITDVDWCIEPGKDPLTGDDLESDREDSVPRAGDHGSSDFARFEKLAESVKRESRLMDIFADNEWRK